MIKWFNNYSFHRRVVFSFNSKPSSTPKHILRALESTKNPNNHNSLNDIEMDHDFSSELQKSLQFDLDQHIGTSDTETSQNSSNLKSTSQEYSLQDLESLHSPNFQSEKSNASTIENQFDFIHHVLPRKHPLRRRINTGLDQDPENQNYNSSQDSEDVEFTPEQLENAPTSFDTFTQDFPDFSGTELDKYLENMSKDIDSGMERQDFFSKYGPSPESMNHALSGEMAPEQEYLQRKSINELAEKVAIMREELIKRAEATDMPIEQYEEELNEIYESIHSSESSFPDVYDPITPETRWASWKRAFAHTRPNIVEIPKIPTRTLANAFASIPIRLLRHDFENISEKLRAAVSARTPTSQLTESAAVSKDAFFNTDQSLVNSTKPNKSPTKLKVKPKNWTDLDEYHHATVNPRARSHHQQKSSVIPKNTENSGDSMSFSTPMGKQVTYGPRDAYAFTTTRFPAIYAVSARIFSEIARRDPNFDPTSVLDFGAGTCSTIWAARHTFPSISKFLAIEPNENFVEVATRLFDFANEAKQEVLSDDAEGNRIQDEIHQNYNLRLDFSDMPPWDLRRSGYAPWDYDAKYPEIVDASNIEFRTILPPSPLSALEAEFAVLNKSLNPDDVTEETKMSLARFSNQLKSELRHSLVTASYVFCEIPTIAEQLSIAENLWDLTRNYLVISEPGTPIGFQNIQRIRDHLLQKETEKGNDIHVFAPCAHDMKCPMVSKSWCHFSQRIERLPIPKLIKKGTKGYEDEKYSFIVLARGTRPITNTQKLSPFIDSQTSKSNEMPNPLFDPQVSKSPFVSGITIPVDSSALEDPTWSELSQDAYSWPRIVRHPIQKRRHFILDTCNPNGTFTRSTISRKPTRARTNLLYDTVYEIDRTLPYKSLKRLKWGDLFPFPESVSEFKMRDHNPIIIDEPPLNPQQKTIHKNSVTKKKK